MYYLRTDKGILVGKLDNRASGMMMNQLPGQWKEKEFTTGEKKTVYEFTEDSGFGNEIMKFVIWTGFYLEKV
jgi:hypothetical protein